LDAEAVGGQAADDQVRFNVKGVRSAAKRVGQRNIRRQCELDEAKVDVGARNDTASV
jgi:hypothetical protein